MLEKYFVRFQALNNSVLKKSYFLFGPRQTGKTSLIKHQFPHATIVNLLRTDEFFRLSSQPSRLREIVRAAKSEVVVIDEIQKFLQRV